MDKWIPVKVERDFGDIIGDGMKLVFRNLRVILPAIVFYAFPFVAAAMVIMIISGAYKVFLMTDLSTISDPFSFSFSYAIIALGLGMGYIMINLIVYVSIMDYHEHDGTMNLLGIKDKIGKYIANYLVSILVEGLIIGTIILIMVGSSAISSIVFSFVYLGGLILLLWVYNIIQFLGLVRIEEGLSVSEGLSRCIYLLTNHWWSTFGVILVASFIGAILMYAFILPISIIIGIISSIQYESVSGNEEFWISILSGIFVILYGIIAILSNMYVAGVRSLKYYDLIERKEANNLKNEIDRIGSRDPSSNFENEGEL